MFLMNQPNNVFYIMNIDEDIAYADLACLWHNNHVTITLINQLNH
jgi:hypothetical protein